MIIADLDYKDELDLKPICNINKEQKFIFLASKRSTYENFIKEYEFGYSGVFFKPLKFSAIMDNILLLSFGKKSENFIFLSENLKVNLDNEKIYFNENEIFLSPLNHLLLLLFASNKGVVITFEMIEDSVYKSGDVSRVVIQNLVGKLRKKLSLKIKNIYSKGYLVE